MAQISLTFPDGNSREYEAGVTGYEVAESIAKSLAKKSLAYALDGEPCDLSDPITSDGSIELITRSDEYALELIRHDCAHVLAEAVQELWPGTQVTIGPVIENVFLSYIVFLQKTRMLVFYFFERESRGKWSERA